MGGLLLKLWLSDPRDDLVKSVKHAVSVGTPFYGYGGQIHCYFVGVSMFDFFHPPAETAAIIASMDGLYALFFSARRDLAAR